VYQRTVLPSLVAAITPNFGHLAKAHQRWPIASVRRLLAAVVLILLPVAGHGQKDIDFSPAPILSKPKYVICEATTRNYSGAKRFALVIGNTDYTGEFRRLENAVNDAKSISTELLNAGFEVCYVNNLNLAPFNEVVAWFAQRIEKGSQVLFYFSGHGLEPAGVAYLMPVDASLHKDAANLPMGIDLQELWTAVRSRAPQMALYVIDACRSNPYKDAIAAKSGTNKGNEPSTVRLEPPVGTATLFSASPNEDSIDKLNSADKDLHSLFTRELLPLMREDGLSLRNLAQKVTDQVHLQSKGHQTPAPILGYAGEFYFHPMADSLPKTINTANPATPSVTPATPSVAPATPSVAPATPSVAPATPSVAPATPSVAIVEFVNKANEPVTVYWDTKNGTLMKYSEIAVNKSYSVQTYAGHTWVIRGVSGREYLIFTPDSSTKTARVEIIPN
jgi:uncharacterized caspase-like protein